MDNLKYATNESFNIMDIAYLFLISLIFQKEKIFYKHHKLFLLVIILIELIRYILQLFYFGNADFIFPDDLKYVIALILFPFADSILYYIPKYYMQYNYFSPSFIVCLFGIIYTIISIILLQK